MALASASAWPDELTSGDADAASARAAYLHFVRSVELSADAAQTARLLSEFVGIGPLPRWEFAARIVAAERAFRLGDSSTTLAILLEGPSDIDGYLGAYREYLLGLVSPPSQSEQHFTAAYERSGDTLLRHRAGLWRAERVRDAGDLESAERLFDALLQAPLGQELETDTRIRRAILLSASGRAREAREALADLYIRSPELQYRAATAPVFEVAKKTIGDVHDLLDGPQLTRRAERLLELKQPRRARLDARRLVSKKMLPEVDARILLARTELASGSPQRALAQLDSLTTTGERTWESQELRARALLARGDRAAALRLLEGLFDEPASGRHRIAAALLLIAETGIDDPHRTEPLWNYIESSSQPSSEEDDALWTLAWSCYQSGRFAVSATWFGRLMSRSPEPIHVARGAYWAARAMQQITRVDEAELLYRQAFAVDRFGYYGLISAERLADMGIDAAHPELTAATDPLEAADDGVRGALEPARELLLLGLFSDAVAELDYQHRRFPDERAPAALLSEVYYSRSDFRQSVIWLRAAFPELDRSGVPSSYWPRLYPRPYWDSIEKAASAQEVDPFLAAAVIYQESRFVQRARSGAGALGLMQIMPRTGKEIARQLRDRDFSTSTLFEPERNIRYGLYYLDRQLDTHDGSAALALAAYNAGAGRVRQWTRKNDSSPIDEFIENIPIRETRLYVKKILVAHHGYHQVYDGGTKCELKY